MAARDRGQKPSRKYSINPGGQGVASHLGSIQDRTYNYKRERASNCQTIPDNSQNYQTPTLLDTDSP